MQRTLGACAVVAFVVGFVVAPPAVAQQADYVASVTEVADSKAVFATVEAANVVPARARIGGTVVDLVVDEGDAVEADQGVAVVASGTLALQIETVNARVEALDAQNIQAEIDLARAEDLAERGVLPRARLDEARTQASVVARQLQEARAERDVLVEQVSEGAVLAPTAGRVLRVPVTVGTVVLPGEAVASIASENYVLRLSLPERHARFVSEGDAVELDAEGDEARIGRIVQVYPQITDGRVIADARVDGLGDFFVGERVRVWVSTDVREAMVVQAALVRTRHGVDFVQVRSGEGEIEEVRVQLGRAMAADGAADGVEVLSGLAPGDILVAWSDDGAAAP